MNKRKLIIEIAKQTTLSIQESKIFLNCLIQNISLALKQGDRVTLRDFGAFNVTDKKSKRYYDIGAGDIKISSERKVIKFIPYKKFKNQLFLKVLDSRKYIENDGSIGSRVVIERNKFINRKSIPDKENVAQRVVRKSDVEIYSLAFDGNFLFDCFLGEYDHITFPSLKIPRKDSSILRPQIDIVGATIGVMEPVLHKHLHKMCKEINGMKVLENIKLPILNRNYSYRPDFCLYWEKKKLYIDIEIDEPYDIVIRKPIHYIGNGDDLRDRYFIRNGWCVIRFAEQQIKDDIDGVINYIKRVLRWLTNEDEIKFSKDTLVSVDRWSYEEAEAMSSNNIREHYLNLPDYVPHENLSNTDNEYTSYQDICTFVKPSEDILPELGSIKNEGKWFDIVNKINLSNFEYCIAKKMDGYQWIYTCESLKISLLNGQNVIEGQSPLGFDLKICLDEIVELTPLKELFSNVHWKNDSSKPLKDANVLREILIDAIANGKPIWMAYDSTNSGYSTRFLSNIVCGSVNVVYYYAPHIGLGRCKKYDMKRLSYFCGYCSNRKNFRMFAADERIKELKVLNCDHVYFKEGEYENSFSRLIMHPYESNYGNCFFENADEILHIMPRNEFDSICVQGNLANLQVMKGEIDKAIMTYQQKPYNYFIFPSLTWGEICMSDINYFLKLCNDHLNDNYFYEGLDANIIKQNFEEVLRLLKESSWMQD